VAAGHGCGHALPRTTSIWRQWGGGGDGEEEQWHGEGRHRIDAGKAASLISTVIPACFDYLQLITRNDGKKMENVPPAGSDKTLRIVRESVPRDERKTGKKPCTGRHPKKKISES
jgi:hypothetical protein